VWCEECSRELQPSEDARGVAGVPDRVCPTTTCAVIPTTMRFRASLCSAPSALSESSAKGIFAVATMQRRRVDAVACPGYLVSGLASDQPVVAAADEHEGRVAAVPGPVVRGANRRLVSVDAHPLNYDCVRGRLRNTGPPTVPCLGLGQILATRRPFRGEVVLDDGGRSVDALTASNDKKQQQEHRDPQVAREPAIAPTPSGEKGR
jgi:hypothetical protein